MKFQCVKSDILLNIQQAQNIVGQKATLQILSNLLIEAKDGRLTFTATDLEIGLFSYSKVEILREGRTTVPAKKFFDIVRSLPDGNIEIETDDNHETHIKCGKASSRIFGINPDDYPQLPDFSKAEAWEVNQSVLKKIIKQTNYAISRDESRYVLNGIYLILNSNEIIGVATDGRRLSLSKHSSVNLKGSKIDFILPSKSVNELSKLLSDEGTLKIYSKSNQVSFEVGSFNLITKLIEGNFPEYSAVIPENSTCTAEINKESFIAALNRASILTSEKSNSIKLIFHDNVCKISANTPNVGDAEEEIDAKFEASELQIAFNPHYLIDILKCIEGDTVILELTNSLKPGVIKQGSEFLAVIMPMRLE